MPPNAELAPPGKLAKTQQPKIAALYEQAQTQFAKYCPKLGETPPVASKRAREGYTQILGCVASLFGGEDRSDYARGTGALNDEDAKKLETERIRTKTLKTPQLPFSIWLLEQSGSGAVGENLPSQNWYELERWRERDADISPSKRAVDKTVDSEEWYRGNYELGQGAEVLEGQYAIGRPYFAAGDAPPLPTREGSPLHLAVSQATGDHGVAGHQPGPLHSIPEQRTAELQPSLLPLPPKKAAAAPPSRRTPWGEKTVRSPFDRPLQEYIDARLFGATNTKDVLTIGVAGCDNVFRDFATAFVSYLRTRSVEQGLITMSSLRVCYTNTRQKSSSWREEVATGRSGFWMMWSRSGRDSLELDEEKGFSCGIRGSGPPEDRDLWL